MFLKSEFCHNEQVYIDKIIDLGSLVACDHPYKVLEAIEEIGEFDSGESWETTQLLTAICNVYERIALDEQDYGQKFSRYNKAEAFTSHLQLAKITGAVAIVSMSQRQYHVKDGKIDENQFSIFNGWQRIGLVYFETIEELREHTQSFVHRMTQEMKEEALNNV